MDEVDGNEDHTCVYMNFDTVPFVADLVFPKGIACDGYVSLICGTFGDTLPKRRLEKIDELARSLGKKFRVQSPIVEGVPQCFIRISLSNAAKSNCSDINSEEERGGAEEKKDDVICDAGVSTTSAGVSEHEICYGPEEAPKEDDSLSSQSESDSHSENDDVSVSSDSEEKEYLCCKCPASFESAVERRDHMFSQHNVMRGCPFCQRKFLEKYALVRHMWSHLPPYMMPFRCSECKATFLSKGELLLHKVKPDKCDTEGRASENSLLASTQAKGQAAVQEVYMCEFCSGVFLTNRGYTQHMNKCHKEDVAYAEKSKEQLCSFCNLHLAPNFRDLCVHLSEQHPESHVFPCKKCSQVFTDQSEMEAHEKMHFVKVSFSKQSPGRKIYHCNVCEETLATLGALVSHIRSHNANQDATNYICDVCYKTFGSRCRLRRHFRKQHLTPSGEDVASACACSVCQKIFTNQALLRRHHRCVHDRCLPHACRRCPKKFAAERQLQRHLAVSHRSEMTEEDLKRLNLIKKFVCHECGFATYSDKTIRRHVYTHSGSYPHTCDECGRGFVFRFELTNHRSRHHNRERYTCERCPRVFYSHDRFSRHVSAHEGGWGFPCLTCGQLYETKGYLESHQLVHSEHSPYVCSVCGRHFKTPQSLTFHNVGHHGSRSFFRDAQRWPYRCYVCNVSFKYMSSLHAHNACHHVAEEQRLECQYCSKRFRSKVTLSQHIRTHTLERAAHYCGHCKKSFASYSALKRHIIVTHPAKHKTDARSCSKRSALARGQREKHVSHHVQEAVIEVTEGELNGADSLLSEDVFMEEEAELQ
ncbi:zinc finger protein 665-like [Ornithodoros turicata]|uniref:zinc finger protein 665-like n=1 Tax=Ornithodoros turicata TaxID=34597 RepID=UPI003138610E